MSERRTSVLSRLGRHPDPARSTDPRIHAIVAELAELPIAPQPEAQFRAELRAQLVAVTPRIVSESAPERVDGKAPAGSAARFRGPKHAQRHAGRGLRRGASFARPLTISAAIVTVLTLLLGGATWLSRKSLPGDALYSLKRASESAQLVLDSSPRDEAQDRLRFARTRVTEAQSLLGRTSAAALGTGPQAGRISARTADLIEDALDSADGDVRTASRQLGTTAIQSKSSSALQILIAWAPGQLARLTQLEAAMPTPQMRAHVVSSSEVVGAALARATALRSRTDCACMSGARSDSFGPVPCSVCPRTTGATSSGAPVGTGVSVPLSTAVPKVGTPLPPGSKTPYGGGTGKPNKPKPTVGVSISTPKLPTQPLPLPPLPTHKISLSVTPPSCVVSVSPGPVGVLVTLCPTPHS